MNITLVTILIFCAVAFTNAQRLILPDVVDLGDWPIDRDTSAFTVDPTISRPFHVYNMGKHPIFIQDVTTIFDNETVWRSFKGPIYSLYGETVLGLSPEQILEPGDSASYTISYRSGSIDSISESGGKLQARIVFKYRYNESFEIFTDTVILKVRNVPPPSKPFTTSFSVYEGRACSYNLSAGFDPPLRTHSIQIFNTSNKDIIIDSISSFTKGKNYRYGGLIANKGRDVLYAPFLLLPYHLKKDSSVSVGAEFKVQDYGLSQCFITVYCRYAGSDSIFILKDSINYMIRKLAPGYFYNTANTMIASKVGDVVNSSSSGKFAGFIACTDEPLYLDSVTFSPWDKDEMYMLPRAFNLPTLLDPSFKYVAEVEFVAKMPGKKEGYSTAYFHTLQGESIIRRNFVQTFVTEPTFIFTEQMQSESKILLYPNPVRDELSIRFGESFKGNPVTIDIRDVFGKTCFSDICNAEEIMHISLLGFSSGIYVVRVHSGSEYANQIIQVTR
jgi:hypothetical protein